MQRNKRVVISGSPGSGKTAVIECLKNKGYSIFEEFSMGTYIVKSSLNSFPKD